MVRTSIVLMQETIDWLNKEAKESKRSFAYVLREKLESLQKKKPAQKQKR
jgi:predicted DNA-binding protein